MRRERDGSALGKRRSLLNYLKQYNVERYRQIVEKLGLRR